jgi:fructokinase
MNEGKFLVVGLGELLWDIFPSGERLGGAPANFAYMTALLGDRGVVASRVGADALGKKGIEQLQQAGLTTSYIQIDRARPTGTVPVELDEQGKPTFTIREAVAWDNLEWTASWQELATRADAVCFGSLAQRSPQSRQAIRSFLDALRNGALVLFDVNLRTPFYSADVLSDSLTRASVVKLNDEELPLVIEVMGLRRDGSDEDVARRLLRSFELQLVCVTRGSQGSLLVTGDSSDEHAGFKVAIADTVGAGDAFSAAIVYHCLRDASLVRISEAANRLGSWVATQVGATPSADPEIIGEITQVKG